MIKLNLKNEPYWIDLGDGIRVFVRPATTPVIEAARADAQKDGGIRGVALLSRLAEAAIISWEGVGDADGKPVEPSPEYVAALMASWPVAKAFEDKYLRPALTLETVLEKEKNG